MSLNVAGDAAWWHTLQVLSRVKFITSKDLPGYIPHDQFPHVAGGTIDRFAPYKDPRTENSR